ncbi:27S pre-rRNA (guanosine(2922)-2'-O)-methyltransferase [Diutina catenulata]
MGKITKKNAKGRLDKYYFLAKEKGYRARSSFKIVQINEKFGHFLEKSKVVIDLCAAPGSWCQVASQLCPVNSLIIGVDIVPIKPLPNCITFQSDITTDDCRSKLRGHMKTWKADTVLHDGAPNVGLGWVQDAFTQSQLTLQALKLAVDNLAAGGTFVTKIFRSRDYNNLMWVFQQLFDKVEATKPPASRNVSAEIFVVCRGYKAPKKLDPRLLDPKEVFEELGTEKVNNEQKIFNPEVKRRHRSGYADGDYTLYHEMKMVDFIRCDDPINVLGGLNKLTVPSKKELEEAAETAPDAEPSSEGDADKQPSEVDDWRLVKKLKTCNTELLACLEDLKVLGKKDFKQILRFRKQARELLGLDLPDEEAQVEEVKLTEDEQIDRELAQLTEKQRLARRRDKKHANEAKQKEIVRNQMNMLTDMNIGIDAAQSGAESFFNLTTAKKTGQLDKLQAGKKRMVFDEADMIRDVDIHIDDELTRDDRDSGDELDGLEAQLDDMYDQYKQRRAERDAKFRARQLKGEEAEEWDGIRSDDEVDSDGLRPDDSDSDDDEHIQRIVDAKKGLTRQAKLFYATNDIFGDVSDDALLAQMEPQASNGGSEVVSAAEPGAEAMEVDSDESDESDFELVDAEEEYQQEYNSDDSDAEDYNDQSHQRKVDLATVEAMTLAHKVAMGQMTRNDLVNEGINKFSFRDHDNLPAWFVEDEKRHSKIIKPVTKEAMQALREKQKQLNARPIKKVLEAQGRRKMRALRRMEKLKKKSDLINEDSGVSEADKSAEIAKLMRKFTKKQKVKPKITVVKAAGNNRGLSGRPRGVKGKYKMVDGVSKNEQRALKRIAKKKGKK